MRVREKMIPKAGGKVRRLGIPTVADRVVQAALKLVLEPIFEADFKPCSYGFRPKRRAQDAIAEIHYLASPTRNYEWVFEADITACFDEIDHTALMGRVRARIGDKRVLGLVKAFLRAGVLTEAGLSRDTITGTPQGGILSPCLANIALSVLDEHFARKWEALGPEWTRAKRRRAGIPAYRLVRYADDFVVMVGGTRQDAEALWDEVSTVLAPIGLRLSEEKTRVCHIDEGFDFLGFRIQRRSWRGRTGKRAVYTYPSKKALASVMDKVRKATRRKRHRTLADLLRQLNRDPAGMVQLLPPRGVLADLQLPRPLRLVASRWLAPQTPPRAELGDAQPPLPPRMGDPRRRYRDVPATKGRGQPLPLPGHPNPHPMDEQGGRTTPTNGMNPWRAGCAETCTSGSEGGPRKRTGRNPDTAPRPDPTRTCGPGRGGSTSPPSRTHTRVGSLDGR